MGMNVRIYEVSCKKRSATSRYGVLAHLSAGEWYMPVMKFAVRAGLLTCTSGAISARINAYVVSLYDGISGGSLQETMVRKCALGRNKKKKNQYWAAAFRGQKHGECDER